MLPDTVVGLSVFMLAIAPGFLLVRGYYRVRYHAAPERDLYAVAQAVVASGVALSPIYCPCGTVYLQSSAASAWESMRQASLATYGVDLYPGGPLSAYRTWDQQNSLYQAFLNGTGAPADPPGTSSHETGNAVDVATPEMRSIFDAIGGAYGWGKIHGPGEWWHVDYLGG